MSRPLRCAVLASSLTLAACGGTVVFEEDGGGSGGSGGSGGATQSSAGPTTSGPTTSGPSTTGPGPSGPATAGSTSSGPSTSAVTTGPSGGICGSGVTLFAGQFDACLTETCCTQIDACTRQGTDILGCQNCLDGFGGDCDAALECSAQCLPSGEACSSGLEPFIDPPQDACSTDACCAEMTFCTSAGPRLDDCFECLELGGGPRCDPFLSCFATNCNGQGICQSGVGTGIQEVDACLSQSCCDEFVACTEGGNAVEPCIACFEEGGGPLCDAAITCSEDAGCFDL